MKKDEIEDLFKKSFDNYEAEVSPSVWKNIRVWLKWGGLAFLFNSILNKLGFNVIITIVTAIVAVVGTVGIMNWTHKTPETAEQAAKKTITPVKTCLCARDAFKRATVATRTV